MFNSTRTAFACPVRISEQTRIISLHIINWPVFITKTESVYCAVRTGSESVQGSGSAPSVHTEVLQQRLWRGIGCHCPWRHAQVFCLLVYTSHRWIYAWRRPYTPPPFSLNPKVLRNKLADFEVLLTVHLSIFISVFNQLDAHYLFHNKFLSTRARDGHL